MFVGIHARWKRWLNIGFNAFETSGREKKGLCVFVECDQGSKGKVFEGLGRFEGYFAK
jgi:hypothetical protein